MPFLYRQNERTERRELEENILVYSDIFYLKDDALEGCIDSKNKDFLFSRLKELLRDFKLDETPEKQIYFLKEYMGLRFAGGLNAQAIDAETKLGLLVDRFICGEWKNTSNKDIMRKLREERKAI